MSVKKILLLSLSALLVQSAFAQDKIFQSNGNVIEAKIKTVGPNSITYKQWANQQGPDYTIYKADVDKVKYENGIEEKFSSDGLINGLPVPPGFRREQSAIDYQPAKLMLRNRILSVSPLQFTDNGVGLKFGFEQGIDKEGIIAYELPVALTFNLNHTNLVGNKEDPMFYFMPGLKFYPTSSYGKIKYSIGPSLLVAAGQKTSYGFDNYGATYTTNSHLQVGMIINNTLNFNPTSRFYLGLDFGFGFNYLDKVGGINQGFTGLVQGGFKMGIRY